jgi:hypothetical protein
MVSDLTVVVIGLILKKCDAKPAEAVHALALLCTTCTIKVKLISHCHRFACYHVVFYL